MPLNSNSILPTYKEERETALKLFPGTDEEGILLLIALRRVHHFYEALGKRYSILPHSLIPIPRPDNPSVLDREVSVLQIIESQIAQSKHEGEQDEFLGAIYSALQDFERLQNRHLQEIVEPISDTYNIQILDEDEFYRRLSNYCCVEFVNRHLFLFTEQILAFLTQFEELANFEGDRIRGIGKQGPMYKLVDSHYQTERKLASTFILKDGIPNMSTIIQEIQGEDKADLYDKPFLTCYNLASKVRKQLRILDFDDFMHRVANVELKNISELVSQTDGTYDKTAAFFYDVLALLLPHMYDEDTILENMAESGIKPIPSKIREKKRKLIRKII